MSWQLVTTREIADRLSVSPDWVRDHAGELGGVRLGDAPNAPLRFDPDETLRLVKQRRVAVPESKRRRRPGPARKPRDVARLLPLPD